MKGVAGLDRALLVAVNGFRPPFFDWLMPVVSDFGFFLPFMAVFIAWRLWKGDKWERLAWCGGVMAVIASDAMCARVLKPLVGRPRPYEVVDGIWFYKHSRFILTSPEVRSHIEDTLSWPSCHAMNMWSAASFLFSYSHVRGVALAILAALVCYSRVYLGMHYPVDVVGGAVTGILWGCAAAWLTRRTVPVLTGSPAMENTGDALPETETER